MADNELSVDIGADLKGLNKGLNEATKKLSGFDRKVGKISDVGKRMQSMGKALTLGVTAPLTAVGALSSSVFQKFEQGLAKVKAVSGATEQEFQALSDSARELGSTTRFSASEVAGLQLNLSKLGFDPTQINQASESVLNLALASGEDLAQSAEVAAATIQGFGLSTQEAGRVADVMAKSFSESALDLQKFQIAMANIAPVAKSAGFSIEQATGFLGTLANAGLSASKAGTALKNILLTLSKEGTSLSQAMNRVSTATDKNAAAQELFGREGATAAVILSENAGAADKLTASLQDAEGAASDMASVMDDTQQGAIARMKSALEGAQIVIGEALSPVIIKLSGYVSDLANAFANLSPTTQKVIIGIAGAAAAIGPLLVGLGSLAAALPVIIGGLSSIAGAATVLTGPVGLAAAAITGVAYAVYDNWGAIKGYVEDVINYFIDLYNESLIVRTGVEAIYTYFKITFDGVKQILTTAFDVVKTVFGGIIDLAASVGKVIKGALTFDYTELKSGLTGFKDAAVSTFEGAFEDIGNGAQRLGKDVVDTLNDSRKRIEDNKIQVFEFGESGEAKKKVEKTVSDLFTGFYVPPVETDLDVDVNNESEIKSSVKDQVQSSLNSGGGLTGLAAQAKVAFNISTEGNPVYDLFTSVRDNIEQSNVEELKKGIRSLLNPFSGYSPLEGLNSEETQEEMTEYEEKMKEFSERVSDVLESGLTDTLASVGFAIGEALASGASVAKAAGAALLQSISDVAMRVGKMAIGIGITMLGIKKALTSLGGIGAIAAGVALVTLAGVFSSMSKNIGGSMGGGGGSGGVSTSVPDASTSSTSGSVSGGGMSGGRVVFEIEGTRLVGVLNKTLERESRKGGNIGIVGEGG